IDKQVRGRRLCESTGTSVLGEAEAYLARRIEEARQATVYGVRPRRTFRMAATKYLSETMKRSLDRDARDLQSVDPWIGDMPMDQVHMGTLQPFIEARRKAGIRSGTVNRTLAVVRRVLNLSARLWRDESGLTWLSQAPLIQLIDWNDARAPYPLSWDEQTRLFGELPPHLQRMALFKVNTGTRDQEVCGLRWEWELAIPELKTSVFVIPGSRVKNGEDRLVVLNRVACSVVESVRGQHGEYVFTYKDRRVRRMFNSAWMRARRMAGVPNVRVHDLKHTFGRRLRAAGVPLETRRVLLGHKNGDITTHYSAPEIEELIEAAERVCALRSRKSPALTILRVRESGVRH
ncbi:MAG: tyrosine-type recombinase/integrase, partial [Proteobacteria bacterium]|nr:tyrosine-type recombinase/integrase [Pseudomonadota bacterium]